MKAKIIFSIMITLWTLDYFSTFIALTFFGDVLYETSVIPAFFFSFGWPGWILLGIIDISLIYFYSLTMVKIYNVIKKTLGEGIAFFLIYATTGFLVVIMIFTVINNLRYLLKVF